MRPVHNPAPKAIHMKPNRRDFLLGAMATAALKLGLATPEIGETPIWFEHPAERWLHALPVGNGRIGAMVFGGAARERLHLTGSTLWSGEPIKSSSARVYTRYPQPILCRALFGSRGTLPERPIGQGWAIRYCITDDLPGDRNDPASGGF